MAIPAAKLNDLPDVTTYITGHDESSGKAIVMSTRSAVWQALANNQVGFNVNYTTSEFPQSLNNNKDITTHDELLASGKLGIVNPHGTVCRMVDLAPDSEPFMHRTISLDYGIVLEGEVEMILDSGEAKLLTRGDVAVQRATMHAWRNPSITDWTRMIFILQDCQPLVVAGQVLAEYLVGPEDIPVSGMMLEELTQECEQT